LYFLSQAVVFSLEFSCLDFIPELVILFRETTFCLYFDMLSGVSLALLGIVFHVFFVVIPPLAPLERTKFENPTF